VETPISQIGTIEANAKATVAAAKAIPESLVKKRIANQRILIGIWEGAKQYLLGTFNARWEAALNRMLMNNPNMQTVDAIRQMVLEVLNVRMDDKVCEAISTTPGLMGAISTHSDIKIISDFLDVIDRTKELAYFKKSLTEIAVRYAVKDILDDIALRTQSSDITTVKAALLELGLSQWQIDKSEFSGGQIKIYYSATNQLGTFQLTDFDVYQLAGVAKGTLLDL
jgi:hypothetical protein